MTLFKDMSGNEKIDHIEACLAKADVWDYWAPYLIARCRRLEKLLADLDAAVAEAALGALEDR